MPEAYYTACVTFATTSITMEIASCSLIISGITELHSSQRHNISMPWDNVLCNAPIDYCPPYLGTPQVWGYRDCPSNWSPWCVELVSAGWLWYYTCFYYIWTCISVVSAQQWYAATTGVLFSSIKYRVAMVITKCYNISTRHGREDLSCSAWRASVRCGDCAWWWWRRGKGYHS